MWGSKAVVDNSSTQPCVAIGGSKAVVDNSSTQPCVAIGGSKAVVENGSTQLNVVVGGSEAIGELTSELVRGTRAQTVREQIRIEEDDSVSARSEC